MNEHTTWDGKPVADEAPFGATIVVYREHAGKLEFLVLHRSRESSASEGNWAWTPPSGARYPVESIEHCAQRELKEEVGLDLELLAVPDSPIEWPIFTARCNDDSNLALSAEHDRYEWSEISRAIAICKPQAVADRIRLAAKTILRSNQDLGGRHL